MRTRMTPQEIYEAKVAAALEGRPDLFNEIRTQARAEAEVEETSAKRELENMIQNIDWKSKYSSDQDDKYAFAEVLVKAAQRRYEDLDIIPFLMPVIPYPVTTTELRFKKIRGGRAVFVSASGAIQSFEMKTEITKVVVPDGYYTAYARFTGLSMRRGTWGDVQSIRDELVSALQKRKMKIVLDAIKTSISSADSTSTADSNQNYLEFNGRLDQEELDHAVNKISDVAGGIRSILGRGVTLSTISDFGGFQTSTFGSGVRFPDSANEEILRNGRIGTYRGGSVIYLGEWKDEVYLDEPIDTSTVLVIGQDLGEFAQIVGLEPTMFEQEMTDEILIGARELYVVALPYAYNGFRLNKVS